LTSIPYDVVLIVYFLRTSYIISVLVLVLEYLTGGRSNVAYL
jgi:hypothetical protein